MSQAAVPRKSTKKQLQILTTAKQLFWKYGISRVTVTEICEEAKVSKMTFYRLFENKLELAKVLLENLTAEGLQKYRELNLQDIPFTEKMRQMILMELEDTNNMSEEFLLDIYKNEHLGMQQFWEEKRQEALDVFLDIFKEAQKKGAIRAEAKPEFMLFFLNKINGWITDPTFLKMYDSPKEMVEEIINFFFYGITEKE